MHPYDTIVSRDVDAFPLDAFLDYPRLMSVDWREEEPRMLSAFFKATGLPAEGTALEMDDRTSYWQLVRGSDRSMFRGATRCPRSIRCWWRCSACSVRVIRSAI